MSHSEASLKEDPYPIKPPGKLGKNFQVKVNFYEIFLQGNPTKYHYHVEIEQQMKQPAKTQPKSKSGNVSRPAKKPMKLYKDVVIKFMSLHFSQHLYAYDGGSSLYTNALIMERETDSFTKLVKVFDSERNEEKEFEVTVKLAKNGIIDLSDIQSQLAQGTVESKVITALEIIFKWYSACHPVIQTKKGFYPSAVRPIDIGGGKQIRRGFTHVIVPGSKLFLNVDVIYKIFPKSGSFIKGILEDICVPVQRDPQPLNLNRELTEFQKKDLAEFVRGLKVEMKIPGKPSQSRKLVIEGLGECPAKNEFDCDGKRVTVQKYFKEQKGCELKHPYLPCLKTKRGACFPIELCEILPDQVKRFRSNELDIMKIGQQATCNTEERQNKIKTEVKNINLHENNYFQNFGIEISKNFKEVGGRILDPPSVQYKNKNVPAIKGSWKPEKFITGVPLVNWNFLVFDRIRKDEVFHFEDKMVKIGRFVGVEIANSIGDPVFENQNILEQHLERLLVGYATRKCQILFVIINKFQKQVYSKIKKIAETKAGLLTQCVTGKVLTNPRNDSAIFNILIKVNTKLNGLNHTLNAVSQLSEKQQWCLNNDTMVLGADVTHPAPQDKAEIPSIAAVVVNLDKEVSRYKMEWNFQDPNVDDHEIIQNLDEMIMAHLTSYKKETGTYPKRLVFFRDGVSDGQIGQVRRLEIAAIKNACKRICGEHLPLTFLVVQKRHSTRLFPIDREKKWYDHKNYNVPPGTVVDREIVGQDMHQFYMVPHESMLGTARPTRYKVIWDESNLSADEIQHMAYFLCHIFNRCTRAVSYPAPTYYAHLACFRIRNYLATERINMNNLRREKQRLETIASLSSSNPSYFI